MRPGVIEQREGVRGSWDGEPGWCTGRFLGPVCLLFVTVQRLPALCLFSLEDVVGRGSFHPVPVNLEILGWWALTCHTMSEGDSS